MQRHRRLAGDKSLTSHAGAGGHLTRPTSQCCERHVLPWLGRLPSDTKTKRGGIVVFDRVCDPYEFVIEERGIRTVRPDQRRIANFKRRNSLGGHDTTSKPATWPGKVFRGEML